MYSYTQAGKILGVDRRTIADLVRILGIKVHRHPSNHLAKAIDGVGLSLLSEALDRALDVDRKRKVSGRSQS